MPLEAILDQVSAFDCAQVCVTGGEPLAQPACFDLLKRLCDAGFSVSLETSGARAIDEVDPRVMVVMDLKTPASGEANKNLWHNLAFLKPSDQIKFVICDRSDYDWAKQVILERDLCQRGQVLFSPSWQQLNPTDLADWILEDRLPVRFQQQLHKLLWNDAPGH